MRKKILLFIFTICIGLLFSTNTFALTCAYKGQTKKGVFKAQYEIDSDGDATVVTAKGCLDKSCITNDTKETILNWYKSSGEDFIKNLGNLGNDWIDLAEYKKMGWNFFGKEYYDSNGKTCPPYAYFINGIAHHEFYVSDDSYNGLFNSYANKREDYAKLNLINPDLLDKEYIIEFDINNDNAEGTMSQITANHGTDEPLPNTGFKLSGWTMTGYKVKNNDKYMCSDGIYKETCETFKIIEDGADIDLEFDSYDNRITLEAQWSPNNTLGSQGINQHNLGSGTCEEFGYVWNEDKSLEQGGYCNTDNLTYVLCGDSYDIPSAVPGVVSYIVNFLKIATPIILIVFSVIQLLKALYATNEDEIKKAQKSVIKKITAGVMVFLVITIVQFVILKVADSAEIGSVSECMSCLLNNDCEETKYYKTNIGGTYYCTLLKSSTTDKDGIRDCQSFYEEIAKY